MTPRQKRRFLQKFHAQVEQERNGAPIPGDIAARMTKPKQPETLFQVVVTKREGGGLLPFGPMMRREYCDEFASAINQTVAAGREKLFTHAAVVPLTRISVGVH